MMGETVRSWFKFYGVFILIVFITIGWGVFIYYVSPAVIVEKIGIQNSYLVAFMISAICGFSSITSTTFYVTIGALAKGGANPTFLGLAGGIGLCLSDFIFFYVISRGTHVIDKHWKKFSDFLKRMIAILPGWLLNIFIFMYSAFFPVPNDILLVALALTGTHFKKFALSLAAGDIISTLLVAHLLQ